MVFNRFYVDLLWFREVDYTQVFFKELITKIRIGVPMFVVLTGLLFFYFRFLKEVIEKQNIVVLDDKKKKSRILLIPSAVVSFIITSISVNSLWYRILEFIHAEPF
ncbi:MAG TPA: UPF0182 family protein, partial [Eubacteriaceae bacterium]|nr:UPF0182 family protein [Eubacteriaceae bacterium]